MTHTEIATFHTQVQDFIKKIEHQHDSLKGVSFQVEYDTVKLLTDALADLGALSYKADYRDAQPHAAKVGKALADVLNPRDIATLAYEAWEDMNAHRANQWHNFYWQLSEVNDGSGSYSDLKVVAQTIARQTETVDYSNLDIRKAIVSGSVTWQTDSPVILTPDGLTL